MATKGVIAKATFENNRESKNDRDKRRDAFIKEMYDYYCERLKSELKIWTPDDAGTIISRMKREFDCKTCKYIMRETIKKLKADGFYANYSWGSFDLIFRVSHEPSNTCVIL